MSWPAKGTTYATMYEGKKALLLIALQLRISISSIRTSNGSRELDLGCTCLSPNPCTLLFRLKCQDGNDWNSTCVLHHAVLEHSHSFEEVTEKKRREWVKRLEGKIQAVEEKQMEAERERESSRGRGSENEEWDSDQSSEEEEEEESSESSDSGESEASSEESIREVKTVDPAVERMKEQFPTYRENIKEITALKSGPPLAIPLPGQPLTFTSSRSATLTLHAALRQRGIILNRHSLQQEEGIFEFRCRHGNIRYEGKCQFAIGVRRAWEEENGGEEKWVASCEMDEHEGHDVNGRLQVGDDLTPRKRKTDALTDRSEDDEEEGEESSSESESGSFSEDGSEWMSKGGENTEEAADVGGVLENAQTYEFKERVRMRALGPLLSLTPSPSDSLSQLRMEVCAAAYQRNFTICIRGHSRNVFKLACSRSHSNYEPNRCPWLMKFELDAEEGVWRVTELIDEHVNHLVSSEREAGEMRVKVEVDEESEGEGEKREEKRRKIERSETPSTSTSPEPSAESRSSPSTSATPYSRATRKEHLIPRPTSATATATPSFLTELEAILYHLSPFLAPFAPLLHSIGIDSEEAFSEFLWMDTEITFGLLEAEFAREMSMVLRALLKMKVVQANREIEMRTFENA